MKHYTIAQWTEYIGGQLTEEAQNECETHLYGCDECLQVYMDCVAQLEPQPAEDLLETEAGQPEDIWIEQIMVRIEKQKQPPLPFSPPRKAALYRKPVFQYALAAVITIILMATGILQGVTGGINQQQPTTKQTLDASYTDKLMDKTVAMLDNIQLKAKLIEKGGVNHE